MVRSRLSASVEAPKLDVIVDCGHPLLNVAVDGLIKVGGVSVINLNVPALLSVSWYLNEVFVCGPAGWCCPCCCARYIPHLEERYVDGSIVVVLVFFVCAVVLSYVK